MKITDLKTGFWGYNKFSVYQYITALEESFSAKLLEKDEEHRVLLEQERRRTQQLEDELRGLRQQYESQKREQALIANTLVEAQRYAEQLRAESEAHEQAAQQQLDKAAARQQQELAQYDARLRQLRELFLSIVQEMDGSAERLADEIEQVRADAPEGNLSLFRRNSAHVG